MKHFPKKAKCPTVKIVEKNRCIAKRIRNKEEIKGKSLKEEFDLLIKYRYSNISKDDRRRIWHKISSEISANKTLIGSLEKLIKNNLIGS